MGGEETVVRRLPVGFPRSEMVVRSFDGLPFVGGEKKAVGLISFPWTKMADEDGGRLSFDLGHREGEGCEENLW